MRLSPLSCDDVAKIIGMCVRVSGSRNLVPAAKHMHINQNNQNKHLAGQIGFALNTAKLSWDHGRECMTCSAACRGLSDAEYRIQVVSFFAWHEIFAVEEVLRRIRIRGRSLRLTARLCGCHGLEEASKMSDDFHAELSWDHGRECTCFVPSQVRAHDACTGSKWFPSSLGMAYPQKRKDRQKRKWLGRLDPTSRATGQFIMASLY